MPEKSNRPLRPPPLSSRLCFSAYVVCRNIRVHGVCHEPLCLPRLEPHTSVVISSEPLCRSTKSWQLVPRNSMVIVEGSTPAAVDAAASNANGDCKGDNGVAAAAGSAGDGVSDTCFAAGPSGAAAAAGVGAATPPARKKSLGLGLVSSIRYEPLRCHSSDAPSPNDPAFPDPTSLPTSCARVRSTNGILGSGSGVGNSSMAYLAAKASAS